MPGRPPDAELARPLGQRIGEHDRALLRQPDRRLVPAPAVVQGDEPAGEVRARLDPFEVALRDVRAPEEGGPERARAVPAHEEVDVADVVRLEDDDERRRVSVQSLPDLRRLCRRRNRVEQRDLAAGCDAGRGHQGFPTGVRVPVRMLDSPQPQAWCDVSDLALGRIGASHRSAG